MILLYMLIILVLTGVFLCTINNLTLLCIIYVNKNKTYTYRAHGKTTCVTLSMMKLQLASKHKPFGHHNRSFYRTMYWVINLKYLHITYE